MENIVIVDICGTLFKSNTTFDFVDFIDYNNVEYQIFKKVITAFPIKVINYIINSIFKIDIRRFLTIKFLKGKSKDVLEQLSNEFYENYLIDRINQNVIDKIKCLSGNIILVSATIEPVARTISEKLNINNYFASKLEYNKNGICTGKLYHDLLGRKLEEITNHGYITPFKYTISNDFTDLPLFINSQNIIIIATNNNYGKWEKLISKYSLNNSDIICIN